MKIANPFVLKRRGVLGMNRRNVRYIGPYNDRGRYPLVDNKLKTKLLVQRAKVAVPELLAVIGTQHEVETIDTFLDGRQQFVVKPAQGSGGKGILVIAGRDGDEFLKSSGARITRRDIKRHLSNVISGLYSLGGRPDVAIAESLVVIDETFAALSYEGVPDIRLIVFKGYPVMGMLRLATRDSDGKANLHQGAVGVGLDMGTGRGIAAVMHNRLVTHHPDTGMPLDHVRIPHWRRMLMLASRCYDVTGLGYIGADVVLDRHKGPLLLELNARPGLSIQMANDDGLLPRLCRIEALTEPHLDAADRVDYAMSAFSRVTTQPELFAPADALTLE